MSARIVELAYVMTPVRIPRVSSARGTTLSPNASRWTIVLIENPKDATARSARADRHLAAVRAEYFETGDVAADP